MNFLKNVCAVKKLGFTQGIGNPGKMYFLKSISQILSLHAVALLLLTLYRLIELCALHSLVREANAGVGKAFLNGLWFDNVTMCYISIAPLTVVSLCAVFGYSRRWLRRGIAVWYAVFVSLALMASAANIPYFAYFFKNVNSSIFQWFSYAGTTAGMLWQEKGFWVYILLYFLTAGIFIWADKRICNLFLAYGEKTGPARPSSPFGYVLRAIAAIVLIGGCLFGIRGRVGYNPIKISEAYYCSNPFLNQLGINPMFNLLTSTLDDMRKENRELRLMPYAAAINNARASLGIVGRCDSGNVMRRKIIATHSLNRRNVVFILMESMSANLMGAFGNAQHLTPTLDSLYRHSLAFDNFFSAGIHTNHGITASLYSFPALMFRNLMKGTVTPHRDGIPTVLHEYGYHNMFFMSHESQYDNMKAFLSTNGYDDIYSQENYPKDSVVNSFGVADHFLFDYALGKINAQAATGQPFLATVLTISNHPPYVIPDWFHAKSEDPEWQVVEYADWSVGEFLRQAAKEKWFANTVFVLMADHGKMVGTSSAVLPPSYNHIPLIIYGNGITPRRYPHPATQVDVMPTLLDMLGMDYTYDGFGVNLLQTRRDMVFYSADNQIVGRDANHCYVYQPKDGTSYYYNVGADGTMSEIPKGARHAFKPLRRYAFSMIQTAEYIQRRNR